MSSFHTMYFLLLMAENTGFLGSTNSLAHCPLQCKITITIIGCKLYTTHFILYRAHYLLYNIRCIAHTKKYIMYTAIAHCTEHATNCTIHTLHCQLYTVYFTIQPADCFLSEMPGCCWVSCRNVTTINPLLDQS